ncbi:MAG: hypothetical protein NTZ34_00300 [Chloroflexi bacterium]|nr:hypothetical protein [Chloroflexota bacterium]
MGVTVFVPLVELTEPTPLIEAEVAPLTSHCNVKDWPELTEAGVAVKEFIVGRGPELTVSLADEVTEPAAGVVAVAGGVLLAGADVEGVPVGVADWLGTLPGDLFVFIIKTAAPAMHRTTTKTIRNTASPDGDFFWGAVAPGLYKYC